MKTTALAATLLFAHGQTTERTVTAAERLGRALGVTVKVLTKPAKPPPMGGAKKGKFYSYGNEVMKVSLGNAKNLKGP